MAPFHHHLKNAFIPHHGNDFRPHALRPHWIGVYAALIIAVKIVAVGFVSFYADQAKQSDVTPQNIIALTNQTRAQFHASKLSTNLALMKAAQAKANDMVQAHYFAHISPSKVTPWYWFKQAGYKYSYAGENLAIDFLQSEDVIQAWLNSPSHRANLLSTKYKDIGVAVTTGDINGVNSLLVVQMFGSPVPTTVKKTAVATQTPAPATTKKTLQAAPAPKPIPPVVLGESAPAVAPVVPTIGTPVNLSTLGTNAPTVVGQAEPGSLVALVVDGQSAGTATVPTDGVYSLTPTNALSNGNHALAVTSTARGLTTSSNSPVTVTIDTLPPTVSAEHTYVLSSLTDPSAYDLWTVTSADAATVKAAVGQVEVPVVPVNNHQYYGHVSLTGVFGGVGTITVSAADLAGNQTQTLVADPQLFSSGVVASTKGAGFNALQAAFFSRTFIIVFLVLMLLMATTNVVVEIERQHHPTIIASLLVVYLAGALLFI